MLVQEFLEQSAEQQPGKTCLVCGDIRLTYADVEALSLIHISEPTRPY